MLTVRSVPEAGRGSVAIGKSADRSPAGIVTDDGTLTFGKGMVLPGFTLTVGLATSVTTVASLTVDTRLTEPVTVVPPTIGCPGTNRLAKTPVSAAGSSVSSAETVVPAYRAFNRACVEPNAPSVGGEL